MKLLVVTQKVDENDQLLGFSIGWFRRFAEKFDSVLIFCLEKGRFELPDNVNVVSLGKDRGESKLKQLANFYKNAWFFRKEYDAVFSFMNAIWIVVGWWLWRISGKNIYLWYAHKTVTWKHRLAEKMADGIFTSTLGGFRIKSKKVKIVGQGIDTDIFKPISVFRDLDTSKSLKLLSVGRIAPIKNYEILLNAAKVLRDQGLDFHITMVGEPVFSEDVEYEQKLKNIVLKSGLNSRVSFVGKIINKDLPQYYQSNDVFINLGRTGSLDKTIVEAMACGLNVISSNEAAAEFLPKELIVKGNDSGELAEKIKEISAKNFGAELREYVIKHHSLDNLVEKISSHILTG